MKTFQLQGGSAQQPAEADLLGDPTAQTGFYAAAKHNTFFNMLVLTPVAGATDVAVGTLAAAAEFAVDQKAVLIADAPQAWTSVAAAVAGRDDFFSPFGTAKTNAAVYFPRVQLTDLTGTTIPDVGPSATVAGLHALTDAQRGVWKAAAGIAVQLGGISELSIRMSDPNNGLLNPVAVNCLRSLPTIGNVVWGARTMAGRRHRESQWKYIPVRRLALYIEAEPVSGHAMGGVRAERRAAVGAIRLNVGAFMQTLFRQGGIPGHHADRTPTS